LETLQQLCRFFVKSYAVRNANIYALHSVLLRIIYYKETLQKRLLPTHSLFLEEIDLKMKKGDDKECYLIGHTLNKFNVLQFAATYP